MYGCALRFYRCEYPFYCFLVIDRLGNAHDFQEQLGLESSEPCPSNCATKTAANQAGMQTAGGCSTACSQNNKAHLLRLRKTGLTGSKRFSSDWLDNGGVAIAAQWLLER